MEVQVPIIYAGVNGLVRQFVSYESCVSHLSSSLIPFLSRRLPSGKLSSGRI